MPKIRESVYQYGFRNESKPIVVTWEDEPGEDGLYPVHQIKGEFMHVDNFQHAVLNTIARRKEFDAWLDSIKKADRKNRAGL